MASYSSDNVSHISENFTYLIVGQLFENQRVYGMSLIHVVNFKAQLA